MREVQLEVFKRIVTAASCYFFAMRDCSETMQNVLCWLREEKNWDAETAEEVAKRQK